MCRAIPPGSHGKVPDRPQKIIGRDIGTSLATTGGSITFVPLSGSTALAVLVTAAILIDFGLTLMANLCGVLTSPLPGKLGSLNTTFPGLSTIVDGTGDTLAMLASEEGVIDGTVMLGDRSGNAIPLPRGAWSVPMPWYAPVWPIVQRLSAKAYERDHSRKASASRLSKT